MPLGFLMHCPDKELIHVTSGKECISTSQCVQTRAHHLPPQPSTTSCQPIFVNASPSSLPPRLKISAIFTCLSPSPPPTTCLLSVLPSYYHSCPSSVPNAAALIQVLITSCWDCSFWSLEWSLCLTQISLTVFP